MKWWPRCPILKPGALALCLIAPGVLLTAPSAADKAAPETPALLAQPVHLAKARQLEAQREKYLEARTALSRRQMQTYRSLMAELEGYPLHPYLEYRELTRALTHQSDEQVAAYLAREADSYFAGQLRRQWLQSLAKNRRWASYLAFFEPDTRDTELRCFALRARLEQKDLSALDDVPELWNVAYSQPNACDPAFERWLAEGRLTPELAWERHTSAVKARNMGLASYIEGLMSDRQRPMAQLMREIDRHPERLARSERFREQSQAMQDIIHHGIRRLAISDAPRALGLWRGFDAQQLFSDEERRQTQEELALRLLRQNEPRLAERLLAEVPTLTSTDVIETMIRDSLGQLDWERAYTWLMQLPPEAQDTERWRYWRARLMEELELEGGPEPADLYAAVATTRGFYGFLSADKLGYDYRLLDQPTEVRQGLVEQTEQHPGIARAREFMLTGDINNASREWFHTIARLDHEQTLAAGKLAERWGWYRKGIHAMINAQSWDDLQLRFPLAYSEQVNSAAEQTEINPHLLFAIARQESAFMPNARSPAGALGLMQLMPATAQQTARRAGIPYRASDLLTPDININLGSRYLHQLLNEFDGNRILAAAAYNAGPYRVRQWLNRQEHRLPYDVWIETIPFRETRGYVQNVLAYSVIYGYRLGEQGPFITEQEAGNPL